MEIKKIIAQEVRDLQPASKELTTATNQEVSIDELALKRMKHIFKSVADRLSEQYSAGNRKEYIITPPRAALITDLLKYFMGLPGELNPHKGLLMRGAVGCGKTMLFHIIREMMKYRDVQELFVNPSLQIAACIDVCDEYGSSGFSAIERWTKASNVIKVKEGLVQAKCVMFDDLGTDDKRKHFGNETNVMAKIIDSRYNHYLNNRVLTHFTTNLLDEQIDAAYGTRISSRLKQMCQEITITDQRDYRDGGLLV